MLAAPAQQAEQAPAVTHGSDMLEPLIYAAMMHNGKPKTVADFERAARTVAEMLERRQAAPSLTVGERSEFPAAMGEWLTAVGELYLAMGRPDFKADEPVTGIVETLREAARRLAAQAEPVAGVKVQGSTIYVLNASGANRWWATVQPGQDDDGKRVSDAECEAIARQLASKPAAQAEPVAHMVEMPAGAHVYVHGVKVPTFPIGCAADAQRAAFVEAVNRAAASNPPAQGVGELPPLPEPAYADQTAYLQAFTADQMRAYARAALAQAQKE